MEKDNTFKEIEDEYENVDPEKKKKENEEKEEEPKPENRNSTKYFLITVAIIILMLAAIFGIRYLINPTEKLETASYNNFIFTKKGPLWYTNWQNSEGTLFTLNLHYNPKQTENVSITGHLSDKFNYDEVYMVHDLAEYGLEYVSIATAELSFNMYQALDMMPIAACSKNETEACNSRPIKSCGSNSSVIYVKEGEQTAITLNNTCITIQGSQEEMIRAADKLLYIWYGILKP